MFQRKELARQLRELLDAIGEPDESVGDDSRRGLRYHTISETVSLLSNRQLVLIGRRKIEEIIEALLA